MRSNRLAEVAAALETARHELRRETLTYAVDSLAEAVTNQATASPDAVAQRLPTGAVGQVNTAASARRATDLQGFARDNATLHGRMPGMQPAPPATTLPPPHAGALSFAGKAALGLGVDLAAHVVVEPAKEKIVGLIAPDPERQPLAHEAVRFTADVLASSTKAAAVGVALHHPSGVLAPFTPPGLALSASLTAAERCVDRLARKRARARTESSTSARAIPQLDATLEEAVSLGLFEVN